MGSAFARGRNGGRFPSCRGAPGGQRAGEASEQGQASKLGEWRAQLWGRCSGAKQLARRLITQISVQLGAALETAPSCSSSRRPAPNELLMGMYNSATEQRSLGSFGSSGSLGRHRESLWGPKRVSLSGRALLWGAQSGKATSLGASAGEQINICLLILSSGSGRHWFIRLWQ